MPTPKNFGKAWKLTITTISDSQNNKTILTASSFNWTPEPLQIEFDVVQTLSGEYSGFWVAYISIYNLNTPTANIVLTQGMTVKLEAGYQNQIGFGTIFEGTLYQPTWERVDGINTKLSLNCIVGLVETSNNFVSYNTSAGLTQREIVARMAATPNMAYPLDVNNVQLPNSSVTTRGNVYFGKPDTYLQQFANQSNSNLWYTNKAANIRQLVAETNNNSNALVPTLIVSPTTGLIGTPQQTQDGVNIRINLDARALLFGQVQLTPDVNIKQLDRFAGNFPTILDAQGKYLIARINHVGNSRGNQWDTILTGVTPIGSRLGLQTP